jgi:hypothetical protein
MKRFALFFAALSCYAAGTVQQSINRLGTTDNWVVAFNWTGDASNGSVPVTNAQIGQSGLVGYIVTQMQITPGTPAPTNGYSVSIKDSAGIDMFGGLSTGLSSTTPQGFAPSNAAPPLNGTFSITITGQAVASAKGAVYVFLTKTSQAQRIFVTQAPIGTGSNMFTSRGGVVSVYPPSTYGGTAVVVAPNGSLVSTTGTCTAGLQEAEDFRYYYGGDMIIYGGQDPGTTPGTPGPTSGPITYRMTCGLVFRPSEGVLIQSGSATISCSPAVTGACVKIDSAEISTFDFPGTQIVHEGIGPALLIQPTNPVPLDVLFGIGWYGVVNLQAAVNVHTPASDVAAIPCVEFDMTYGPVTYSKFHITEINGSGMGVRVNDPPADLQGFAANQVSSTFVHSQDGGTNPVIQIGQSFHNGRIAVNQWNFFISNPTANTGKAVSTFEQFGIWNLIQGSATPSYGLFFETGSSGNVATVGQLAGVTQTPNGFSVGGDCDKNRIVGQSSLGPWQFQITPSASPWQYHNTTCQTLVLVVSGGTVSRIDMSSVGSNWIDTGLTAGTFTLKPGAWLQTTYSVVPAIASGIL